LSSEGGRLVLDVTVRYRIDKTQASSLFRIVGTADGLRERIVRPDTRSLVRDVYSRYTAEDGYSLKREIVATTAETELRERLLPRGILLDALKVRDIKLETNLQNQITQKLEAKQAAERALIEQRRAQTEAETRKKVALTDAEARVVRARGEAEANGILTASLTSELLRSKEIEAIASNPNTVLYPYGQPINPFVATSGARSPVAVPTTAPATAETTTTVPG
jgi:regulator of protease activity HflC (stomatin/prohibitin superfamily)